MAAAAARAAAPRRCRSPPSGPWDVSVGTSARGAPGSRSVELPYVGQRDGLHRPARTGQLPRRRRVVSQALHGPGDGAYVIRFESVHHKATVWVDGRAACAITPARYLPFEVRANLRANKTHTLLVRADYRDPTAMKHTGWHRIVVQLRRHQPPGHDPRRRGPSDIVSPFVRTRLSSDGSALVDVSMRIHNRGATRTIAPIAALVHGDQAVNFDFPAVSVPAGRERTVRTQVRVADPALWGPGHPALYDLALDVPGEATWDGRVGLREIRRAGSAILLNGRRLVLHGASIQEDAPGHGDGLPAPTWTGSWRGCAGSTPTPRAHSTRSVPTCSAASTLPGSSSGRASARSTRPATGRRRQRTSSAVARRRVRTSVAQLQTHPSILAWNLGNEVGGQGHAGGQAAYIDAMARELHRTDPGRLVALDIWGTHAPHAPGLMYRHIDVLGLTNYTGWYDHTYASQALIAQRHPLQRRRAAARLPDPRDRRVGVRRGGQRHATRAGGRAATASRRGCSPRTCAPTRRCPSLSGELVWDAERLRGLAAVPRRLDQRDRAEHPARARPQPEGPVHLQRPPEAGGRRGGATPSASRCCPRRSCACRSPRRTSWRRRPCRARPRAASGRTPRPP